MSDAWSDMVTDQRAAYLSLEQLERARATLLERDRLPFPAVRLIVWTSSGPRFITPQGAPMSTYDPNSNTPVVVTNEALGDALIARKNPEQAVLVRTRFVLEFLGLDDELAMFGKNDPTDERQQQLGIMVQSWVDLGSPDEITVSVVAGNQLNDNNNAELEALT